MSFSTDKQTLNDLNLLGKYKVGSMFNLFNRVKTRGGELLLEEMFRLPLSHSTEITERSDKIKYLHNLDVKLDISSEVAEMASDYLTERRPANLLSSAFGVYKDKVQEMLYRSEKLYTQQKKINALQELMLSGSMLLGQLQKKQQGQNHPCKEMQDRLESILNHPDLKNLKAKYPYTIGQTLECNYLLLNKRRQSLEELFHLLYEFDVYISVASTARARGLSYAQVETTENKMLLKAKYLRHPSILDAIGNDVELSGEMNVMFLTGANMAGKSTWMKTLGVSFYLAHMGFPIAAEEFHFTVMDGIYTSINIPDDISQGWSHFYAEVMRVKTVAREVSSGRKIFVLFDELFKGTNVKDAFDATLAVTQKLAKYKRCQFVISTHIIEVGEKLKGTPNIQFRYMPTVMKGAVPYYTYQLTEGITADRQGMIIIENEKILEMLS